VRHEFDSIEGPSSTTENWPVGRGGRLEGVDDRVTTSGAYGAVTAVAIGALPFCQHGIEAMAYP